MKQIEFMISENKIMRPEATINHCNYASYYDNQLTVIIKYCQRKKKNLTFKTSLIKPQGATRSELNYTVPPVTSINRNQVLSVPSS